MEIDEMVGWLAGEEGLSLIVFCEAESSSKITTGLFPLEASLLLFLGVELGCF